MGIKETQEQAKQVTFNVAGIDIETVSEFKYLGRIFRNDDSDQGAIDYNLSKARKVWGMVSRVLSQERSNPKIMASFYKAVVQSILLYGSESWVLTKIMWQKLTSFHHRCARFMTGRHIRKLPDDTWEYPNSEITLATAGLKTMQE